MAKKTLECYVLKSFGVIKKCKVMNSRSHSLQATKTKKKANFIKFKIEGKTYNVSARGLRNLKKMNLTLNQFVKINDKKKN
jgi:ribosomal protein L28